MVVNVVCCFLIVNVYVFSKMFHSWLRFILSAEALVTFSYFTGEPESGHYVGQDSTEQMRYCPPPQ